MAKNEIKVEMNISKLISEIREVIQEFDKLADNLEQIEKKYADTEIKEKTDIEAIREEIAINCGQWREYWSIDQCAVANRDLALEIIDKHLEGLRDD